LKTYYFEHPEDTLAFSDYGGEGQPVLMLPGMGDLRREYRFLSPLLEQAGLRPVAIDLRGHGESSVPWQVYDVPSTGNDLLGLIEYLEAGPAHLIGTSFGAASAVWAAAERPDRVRSLVLINPFVRSVKINPVMQALFWLMMNNPWRVRTWGMYYSSLYPTRKPDDFEDYVKGLKKNLAEPGRFQAAAALAASSRQPSEERLEQVKAPVLVIMGSKDPDFPDPAEEGKILAERTGGRLELIAGAGHYPQAEMPEKIGTILCDFLIGA
jgi:pimeloyl-ACP methyl ester carboxylesterase